MSRRFALTFRCALATKPYHTRRWRLLRLRVFARDNWRCVLCGKAGRLECDHIKPLAEGGDVWDMANLRTLCRGCHIGRNRRKLAFSGGWLELVRELDADVR